MVLKRVIRAILTSMKDNNSSGDKIRLLEVVVDMALFMFGGANVNPSLYNSSEFRPLYYPASVTKFFRTLSLTVREFYEYEASFKKVLEVARDKYNDSLATERFSHSRPLTLEVVNEGQKKVVTFHFQERQQSLRSSSAEWEPYYKESYSSAGSQREREYKIVGNHEEGYRSVPIN